MSDRLAILDYSYKVRYRFCEKVRLLNEQKYSKQVLACRNYIYNNIFTPLQIKDISQMMGLSSKHLSSIIKRDTGMPLRDYINFIKIDKAKNLLIFSEHTLSEITTMLNFYDQSHFTKVFIKHAAQTPKSYQNNNKLKSFQKNTYLSKSLNELLLNN